MMTRLVLMIFGIASLAMGQAATTAALKNPASLKEMAPAKYRANFDTTVGTFVVEVTREWAPAGADRFYNLVKNGYYDNARFYRVVPNFMVQWGFHADPAISNAWFTARLPADPVKQSNTRGYISFAMAGSPDTRTTQLFINYGDNAYLDKSGFAPFGRVVTGMNVVDKINSSYGERPDQGRMRTEGNAYLMKEFPKLDYIKAATIVAN
jgi:peptidyl-prolyl cis-trans isomerase A (cyclophilin A)